MSDAVIITGLAAGAATISTWFATRSRKKDNNKEDPPKAMPEDIPQGSKTLAALENQIVGIISNNIDRESNQHKVQMDRLANLSTLASELYTQAHNTTSGLMAINNADTKNEITAAADQTGGKTGSS